MNHLTRAGEVGKDPTGRKHSGRRRAALIGSAALAASAVTALPAGALEVGDSLEPGDNITVFHNIDFVALSGWADGESITVTVQRNGVEIGTATGNASDPEATGSSGLEVNHGPEGAPLPGDCWEGGTPDIQPGDLVTVTNGTDTDQVIVDEIRFTGDPFLARDGDVVVPFTARRGNAARTPIPMAMLDSAEFRAGSRLRFESTDIRVRRAGSGVAGEYVMRYNAPFAPSRNRDNLGQARLRQLLLGDGHAIGFGHTDPVPEEAMLHDGLADTPGPAPGCPGGSSRWGVNTVTPAALNLRNQTRNVVVRGVATGATAVTARLSDGTGAPVEKPATLNGANWSASFTPQELTSLTGQIKVEGLYTIEGGQITGPAKMVTKDLVAPGAPRASLPSRTYARPRFVRLRSAVGNQIRYTLGNGRQARPTRVRGAVYKSRIRISASQVLKAIAIDPAGNVSKLTVRRYRIR